MRVHTYKECSQVFPDCLSSDIRVLYTTMFCTIVAPWVSRNSCTRWVLGSLSHTHKSSLLIGQYLPLKIELGTICYTLWCHFLWPHRVQMSANPGFKVIASNSDITTNRTLKTVLWDKDWSWYFMTDHHRASCSATCPFVYFLALSICVSVPCVSKCH